MINTMIIKPPISMKKFQKNFAKNNLVRNDLNKSLKIFSFQQILSAAHYQVQDLKNSVGLKIILKLSLLMKPLSVLSRVM
mgnify:CR=1 FL=1